VDFLKTDTDGFDIAVLLGGRETLTGSPVLAVQSEVMFQGLLVDYANSFANVDRLLRNLGFSLFGITPIYYSRGDLPLHFAYPGQCSNTVSGQVVWADVLYCRDLAIPSYEKTWGIEITPSQVLKLACIYELYRLADCAAELLITFRDRLGFDIEPYLDLLTPEINGQQLSYREYNAAFERDPKAFF
jgi:hypothetical protein